VQSIQTDCGALRLSGYRGYLCGVELPGRDVGHSSPFSAVVKNEWSYNSSPSVRRFVLDRSVFICSVFFHVVTVDWQSYEHGAAKRELNCFKMSAVFITDSGNSAL